MIARTRSKASQAGGRTGSRASQSDKDELRAEAAVLPPPYTREMSLIKAKEEGIVSQLVVNSELSSKAEVKEKESSRKAVGKQG